MHTDRAAAERCGVLLGGGGGAPELVRLDEVRPAVIVGPPVAGREPGRGRSAGSEHAARNGSALPGHPNRERQDREAQLLEPERSMTDGRCRSKAWTGRGRS